MKNKLILLLALCVQMPLWAQNDTIIRQINDTSFRQVVDTVTKVTAVEDSILQHRDEVVYADSTDRRGHYIEAHVGLGYGSLGYTLNGTDNRVDGSFSGLLQLQYAYFFHQNWGVGIGAWFTNYTSFAHLGGIYQWYDQTDTDLEQHYDHTADVQRWRERETLHNVGIPVSLQFQYKKDDWKARIFAELGVAPSFSVMKKYNVLEGIIDHTGHYPAWALDLTDMHEFGIRHYENEECAKGTLSVRPQVAVFADLGALIPLTKQIDFFIGGYFNIIANDANSSDKQPLGWRTRDFSFMSEYKGAYATDLASASHPWEAGVKIGIHWHHIAKPKHHDVEYFDHFTRMDTTVQYVERQEMVVAVRLDTVIEAKPDNVQPKRIRQVAEEVEKFNKIYFAFDSYELTNKAKNYLLSIVDALNQVPEAKIAIDGHASVEGQAAYNDILSMNRAKAVSRFLINHGVDKDRVVLAGHGSRIPNDETDREELKRDRRVEVRVIQDNENK